MSFLLLVDGSSKLLLVNGTDALLLVGDEGLATTFPLLTSQLVVTLDPWQGTTFPLLRSRLFSVLGEINLLDTTFPLLFSVVGNPPGSFSTSFPLLAINLFAVVNVQVGSGIYKMVVDDTHDTYYNHVLSGTTIDATIPEPSVQSALYSDEEENFIHIAAARLRVVGSGLLKSQVLSLDSVNSQQLDNIALRALTNLEPSVLANFTSRRVMIKYYTENIDEFFDVSRIILFLKPIYSQKPQ